jgi:hypothetical protein
MTVLVGVRCTDGVVIGADSIATSSAGHFQTIRMLTDDKIKIVGDKVIIAGTGSVGLGQRFHAIVQDAWDKKLFTKPCIDCLRGLSAAGVNDFRSTGTPQTPQQGFGYGAMIAAPISNQPELAEFGLLDFQPERKIGSQHFVTMGSGQLLADPFMAFVNRVLWNGVQPDVKTGMFGVYWALEHACEYAPQGVGKPIKLATLRRENGQWNAKIIEQAELQEQSEHISAIEARIGRYPAEIISEAKTETLPEPPKGK